MSTELQPTPTPPSGALERIVGFAITRRWLAGIGLGEVVVDRLHGPAARDRAYDQLAEHTATHLNLEAIIALLPPQLREVRR